MGIAIRAAGSAVDNAFNWVNNIRKSPDATETAIRLAGFTALATSALAGVSSPFLNNVSGRALANADLINCVQLLPSLQFAVSGQYTNPDRSFMDKVINALFTTIGINSVVLSLSEWQFIDLGRTVAALGNNVSILKPLTELSVTFVLRSQLTAAYGCIFLSNVKSLCFGNNNSAQKRQILFDIAYSAAQIAFNVFIIGGTSTASPLVIGLGITAYGLGTASFLHKVAFDRQINPVQAPAQLNEAQVPAYNPPTASPVARTVDFASRLSEKFEGLDTACKFTSGAIDFYGLFAPVTAEFKNMKANLASLIDFNKATNLFPRTQKVGQQICEGRVSFQETLSAVCLLAVTVFESLTWYWSMSDLGKAGNVFKLWRNGIFITGLTASVTSDSMKIAEMEKRVREAQSRERKWQNHPLKDNPNVALVADYYQAKLLANPTAPQAKRDNWTRKLTQINQGQFNVAAYRTHIAKKKGDWEGIKEYRKELMETSSNARNGTFLKIVSLALDVAVISMTVCSFTSVALFGAPFALLATTQRVFTTVNFALGCVSMNNLYFKEYTVEARKEYLLKDRQINPARL